MAKVEESMLDKAIRYEKTLRHYIDKCVDCGGVGTISVAAFDDCNDCPHCSECQTVACPRIDIACKTCKPARDAMDCPVPQEYIPTRSVPPVNRAYDSYGTELVIGDKVSVNGCAILETVEGIDDVGFSIRLGGTGEFSYVFKHNLCNNTGFKVVKVK